MNFKGYLGMTKISILSGFSKNRLKEDHKKNYFLKEEISNFLINLGKQRLDLHIEVAEVIESLKFSTRTVKILEKGKIDFIQYPLNYFFTRQYASFLKLQFPENFKMKNFRIINNSRKELK